MSNPSNTTNLSVTENADDLEVTWTDPTDDDFSFVRVFVSVTSTTSDGISSGTELREFEVGYGVEKLTITPAMLNSDTPFITGVKVQTATVNSTGNTSGIYSLPLSGSSYLWDNAPTMHTSFTATEITSAVSSIDTGTDRITFAATHNFVEDELVCINSNTTMPAGTVINKPYAVKVISTTVIELKDKPGGSTVNLTSAGSGTIIVGYLLIEWVESKDDFLSYSRVVASSDSGSGSYVRTVQLGESSVKLYNLSDAVVDFHLFAKNGTGVATSITF